jgi:hypothetical protein
MLSRTLGNARRLIRRCALVVSLVVCSAVTNFAASYSFVNVADTTTAGPTGTLSSFGRAAISGDQVAFFATSSSAIANVFVGSGGPLTTVVKQGDPTPNATPGGFASFGFDVSMSDGQVAFWGNYQGGQGIFTGSGGAITPIVRSGDPAPVGNFRSQLPALGDAPAIDEGRVAFVGSFGAAAPFPWGVFRDFAGVRTTIATSQDLSPSGQPFNASDASVFVAVSGDNVAFKASYNPPPGPPPGATPSGVFRSDGGPPTVIAKSGDPAPTGQFVGFSPPAISGAQVAFRGVFDGTRQGVFAGDGGPLTAHALTGDAAPAGLFESFGDVAVSANAVVFQAAFGGGATGLFVSDGSALTTIVKKGDLLFGSTVASVSFGRFGLDQGGGRVAFGYRLDDGRRGVAIAALVPEPNSIALIVAAIAAVLLRRRIY